MRGPDRRINARAAAGRRWLSAAILGASVAVGGGAFAGCGDDKTSAGSTTANAPAARTQSGHAPIDPTGNTYDATSEPRDARIEIAMKDIAFKPQQLTARVGQTLVFTNYDDVIHKIRGVEGQYHSSKKLSKGQTYEYKIKRNQLRSIGWVCTIHPAKMTGGAVLTE
jgi:plastocyanin